MAKIEMDISEYEEMKKNTKLLEEALKKQETLYAEIDKLKEEKIEVMKENEKSITIIEEVHTNEHVLQLLPHEIGLKLMAETVQAVINIRNGRISSFSSMDSSIIRDAKSAYDYLTERLFSVSKSTGISSPQVKTVVYKGLDEVTERIRSEVLEEQSKNVSNKLSRLVELEDIYTKIKEKYDTQKKELDILRIANSKLTESNESYSTSNDEQIKAIQKLEIQVDKTYDLISDIEREVMNMSIFNKRKIKQNVTELIKSWEKSEKQ